MKTREEMQAAHDALWLKAEADAAAGVDPFRIRLQILTAETLCWAVGCTIEVHDRRRKLLNAVIEEAIVFLDEYRRAQKFYDN